MSAEQAIAKIADIIHLSPAGDIQAWGKIQAVLLEYMNQPKAD